MATLFKISSPQITSEVVDGEVMIINLQNGQYFNINGSSLEIWAALQEGASREAILAGLSQRYSADAPALAASLDQLLEELQKDELIAVSEGSSAELPVATEAAKASFIAPILSKFSDMQELLLLDPIHDVDDAGWPRAKAN